MGSLKIPPMVRRTVRFIYALSAIVLVICIVLQVFIAGSALFSNTGNWKIHADFVSYFEFIPLGMFLLSFIAKINGKLRWISLGMYLLILLQYMTIHVFSGMGNIIALHPVFALILFWGGIHLVKNSYPWLTAK
ncbi:DUF6220 domain-containing protein [Pseudalkalibacillus salsuginis]|uniref:DUF6220 domain-containing protein n=1 Tax=Pseudalkalibacillus salsuginis TaxID=2910972 RepID=UPI001F234BDB|nr:DUF6220 domain-containing protein [Pseudalkalibacillus salsuginis]MCF6409434.1 DUF6220 domain-containing protein [Pseudalkalibacillus salsuginis]